MSWSVEYLPEALEDWKRLDQSQQIQVIKGIRKVSQNPLPVTEGGLGKPLRNTQKSSLAGCCKIKFQKLGLRVVYQVIRTDSIMRIIVISVRADETAYGIADSRLEQ